MRVEISVVFLKIGEIDTLKEQYEADVLIKARWREPLLDKAGLTEVGVGGRKLLLRRGGGRGLLLRRGGGGLLRKWGAGPKVGAAAKGGGGGLLLLVWTSFNPGGHSLFDFITLMYRNTVIFNIYFTPVGIICEVIMPSGKGGILESAYLLYIGMDAFLRAILVWELCKGGGSDQRFCLVTVLVTCLLTESSCTFFQSQPSNCSFGFDCYPTFLLFL